MYLFLTFLDQAEQSERAIRRLREFGVPEPLVVESKVEPSGHAPPVA